MACLFPSCCWSKKEKITKLFDISEHRLESALDLVKLVKNMRNQRILLKSFNFDKMTCLELAHTGKNVINLSDSDT